MMGLIEATRDELAKKSIAAAEAADATATASKVSGEAPA
jgi:hypothetical protein